MQGNKSADLKSDDKKDGAGKMNDKKQMRHIQNKIACFYKEAQEY
jgi:hypothetical protein